MRTGTDIEQEIVGVMEEYRRYVSSRDVEGLLALYSDAPDTLAIGTGQDEKYVGKDEMRRGLERDFAQSEAMDFALGWRAVSQSGGVAWLAADVRATAIVRGKDTSTDGRLTAVFERGNGKWLIRQSHFSVPASDQPEGSSFRS